MDAKLTAAEIDELERLEKKEKPRIPWEATDDNDRTFSIHDAFGDFIAENLSATASNLIVEAVNALPALLADVRERARECIWSEDENENWWTACNHGFVFTDLEIHPRAHVFAFCPYCGGRLIEKVYVSPCPEPEGAKP